MWLSVQDTSKPCSMIIPCFVVLNDYAQKVEKFSAKKKKFFFKFFFKFSVFLFFRWIFLRKGRTNGVKFSILFAFPMRWALGIDEHPIVRVVRNNSFSLGLTLVLVCELVDGNCYSLSKWANAREERKKNFPGFLSFKAVW